MDGSLTYLRIYFAGILFVLVYNMGSAVLRATGDSRSPLYILIICCAVNIVLDTVFVLVFGLGVAGVAIATLIAQAVSAFLVTWRLMRSGGILHLSLRADPVPRRPSEDPAETGAADRLRIHPVRHHEHRHPGRHQYLRDRHHCRLVRLRQTGRHLLDGEHGIRHLHHHIRRPELRRRPDGPGLQKHAGLPGHRPGGLLCACILSHPCEGGPLPPVYIRCRRHFHRMRYASLHSIRISIYVFIEILGGSLRGRGNVIVPVVITLLGVCALRIVWLAGVLKLSPTIHSIILSYPVTWVATALAFTGYYILKAR